MRQKPSPDPRRRVAIFYKRRLSVYNLTVYNAASKRATNYMWHEGVAKRGSIEIASCIYQELNKIADGHPIILFSDACGGQNRNINMCTMFLYAVQTMNIPVIDQCFFEAGHSVMECDSVHANIERAAKNINIYDPSGWFTVVQTASKQRRYEVVEMDQKDFLDFGAMQKERVKNKKVDNNGNRVQWLKIVCFQYRKSDTNHIFFKYAHEDEFKCLAISRKSRTSNTIFQLTPKYHIALKLQEEKIKDLLYLCRSGIIKQQYHDFYKNLQEKSAEESAGVASDSDDDDDTISNLIRTATLH